MIDQHDPAAETHVRGFALPAVIGALVIIGILMTAGFFMAQQELRIGVASRNANMAVNIAQAGANEVFANWNGYALGNIPEWGDTTVSGTLPEGTWEVSVKNANNYVYFLNATGTVTEGGALWSGAQRTIGLAAKILFVDIDPPAALMTRGPVNVGGNADIFGTNTTPPAYAPYCTSLPTNDTTGIMVDDDMGGTNPSVGKANTVAGNPPTQEDSTIVDSTFTNFGNLNWDELVAIAKAEGNDLSAQPNLSGIGPTEISGRCDTSNQLNWGDTVPTNTCGSYFPLIYHDGPVDLQSNSYGQGILLVNGNLRIRGGFTFMGIIITQGTFTTGNGTNTIYGSVMASNAADLNQTLNGTGQIYYSRCAITRAVLNNNALSRARPVDQRSWVDLTAVAN